MPFVFMQKIRTSQTIARILTDSHSHSTLAKIQLRSWILLSGNISTIYSPLPSPEGVHNRPRIVARPSPDSTWVGPDKEVETKRQGSLGTSEKLATAETCWKSGKVHREHPMVDELTDLREDPGYHPEPSVVIIILYYKCI